MTIRKIATLGLVLAGMGASTALMANAECELCTQVETGVVKGHTEGEVVSFKGIPYAAAPVGELRFRAPQRATAWSGVLDAASYKSTCPQMKDPLEEYPFPGRVVSTPAGKAEIYESEDCLHLNVWTPAADGKKRPIMVYIPGGAFVVGNGSSDFYNGSQLASHDVVVVTLNYRVGLFGFMELGGVDPKYAGSGNNGLRDQIAAIEWVKRNAAAFGGDPDNVTVFGESAGAASVTALMSIKDPEKLYKRAIVQSGNTNLIHTKEFALSSGQEIAKIANFRTVGDALKASSQELLMAQEKVFAESELGDLLFAPFADGRLIIGTPNDLIRSGNAKAIDIMVGATQNELNYWNMYDSQLRNPFVEKTDAGPASPLIPGEYRADLEKRLGKTLDEAYRKSLGTSDHVVIRSAQNDDFSMIQPATMLAERQSAINPNVYLYRFRWDVPKQYLPKGQPDLGSVHALEIPFMFGTLDLAWVPGGEAVEKEKRDVEAALAKQMMSAWTNFAKTGSPNGVGVPHWPQYDKIKRQTMVWDEKSAAESDPESDRRQIWTNEEFGSLL